MTSGTCCDIPMFSFPVSVSNAGFQQLCTTCSLRTSQRYSKVGPKKLFIEHRGMVEMTPLSVLDFYIHESVQRGGSTSALALSAAGFRSLKTRKFRKKRVVLFKFCDVLEHSTTSYEDSILKRRPQRLSWMVTEEAEGTGGISSSFSLNKALG